MLKCGRQLSKHFQQTQNSRIRMSSGTSLKWLFGSRLTSIQASSISVISQPAQLYTLIGRQDKAIEMSRIKSHTFTTLTVLEFEQICEDTLESLCAVFEELLDLPNCPSDYDVNYSSGILTVVVGNGFGTYVINRQTPNAQIWLSSPISGPKRYDFIDGKWVYKHDNSVLHKLLTDELAKVFGKHSDFSKCVYSGL